MTEVVRMDKKKLKWYCNLITVDSVKVVITGPVNMHLVLISIGAIEKIIVLVVHSVEGTMLAVMEVDSN